MLILPFAQPPDAHRDLGFGIELKVTGALRALGRVNLVHPKIRDSIVRRHSQVASPTNDEQSRTYAGYVGATWILTGRVDTAPSPRIALRLMSVNAGSEVTKTVVASSLKKTIGALPEAARALINSADDGQRAYRTPIAPHTDRPDVLARLATCYRMLNAQSVGIRKPALLNDDRVFQAGNRCREALRREPTLVDAEAGLAMVDALQGRVDEAKTRLGKIKDHPAVLPYYGIAKFWVLAKFFSPGQAIEALRTAIAQDPGFMLARGYLGEALSVLGAHKDALDAFQAYLARVPEQPFVMTRIGHELARLGRHNEGIAITRKALAIHPSNAETRMQLGSRLIDGHQFNEAAEILDRLVQDTDARGEIYLRLGYAQLQRNRLPEAERAFRTALDKATAPQEWKTRGRAHYDLAKVHVRQKKLDLAFADLGRALDAGFYSASTFKTDDDLEPLRNDERFAELMKRKPRPPEIPVRFDSPFVVDADELARAAAQFELQSPSRAAVDF